MMGLRCGSVAKATMLGLLIPLGARAGFVLEAGDSAAKSASDTGTFKATLRWLPQQKTALPKSAGPVSGPQGAMLLLPGPASSATVSTPFKSAEAAFTVKTGFVGTLPFVQILADPTKAAGATDVPVTVEVALTGEAIPSVPLADDPLAGRVAADLFLNASALTSVPTATTSSVKALPAAPGDYRVTVRRGLEIVRVPLADLGTDEAGVAGLSLWYHGNTLPVGGAIDGNLWFYMPRSVTPSANSDTVFITRSSGAPSAPVATRPAFETLAPAGTEAALTRTRDYSEFLNIQYERASILPPTQRFVAARISAQSSKNTNFTRTWELPVYDWVDYSQPIMLKTNVLGHNDAEEFIPDHRAELYLNDVKVPPRDQAYPDHTAVWDGRTSTTVTASMTIPAGANPTVSLRLKHEIPAVPPAESKANSDIQMLDSATLTWVGYARVDDKGRGEVAVAAAPAARRVTVGGLPAGSVASDVVVLDVTNPRAPVQLTSPSVGTANGTTFVEFEAGPGAAKYYVAHKLAFTVPMFVGPSESLPAPAATDETLTTIIVRFPAMAAAAAPLAQLRTGKTIFLDPQAAYNAYSSGQQDPVALRQAIRDLVDASPTRSSFPYLILFGHGTFDRENFLNRQTGTEIPAFIYENTADTPTIEDASDRDYALVVGDDQLEDLIVSRIPARSAADAVRAVTRLQEFKASEPVLNQRPRVGLFVVDYRDGRFQADVDSYAIPAWKARGRGASKLVIVPTSGDEERAAIRKGTRGTDSGVAMLVYTGHGNFNVWAGENVLRSNDVAGGVYKVVLKEGDPPVDVYFPTTAPTRDWPFVVSFTCLNNLYATPGAADRCLGEALLIAPEAPSAALNAGGNGVLAPSSVETYEQQSIFSYFAYQILGLAQDAPRTQGEWLLRTRNRFLTVSNEESFRRTARIYLLFGDGATNLTLDQVSTERTATGLVFE